MLNKKLKLSIVLFLALSIIFSFSLNIINATDDITPTSEDSQSNEIIDEPSDDSSQTSTNEEETVQGEEVSGDLYLFENDITMDKLVDGNVFIFGKNVTLTGQINGNLFVFADSVKFEGAFVRASAFVCAKNVYYNGYANDLYVATDKLEMTYDSYVIRDVKAVSSEAIIKAAIGRDLDLSTNKVDFGTGANSTAEANSESEDSTLDEEVPIIYGNLRYSANNELSLKEGIVEGEVTYHKEKLSTNSVLDIILNFAIAIVTVIVISLLLNKFASKFVDTLESAQWKKALIALGVGLVTLITIGIISVLLMLIKVGAILGFILLAILLLLCLLAAPIVAIFATEKLYTLLKLDNKILQYVILAVVAIIISALKLIPYVGIIISVLIKSLGIGLILLSTFSKEN